MPKLKRNDYFVLALCLGMALAVFIILALEQDQLNRRIRTLELKAGMPDPWAEVK